MQDGFKIGISAGVAGTAVGLALQNTQDPMLQTIGQGWLLGGVVSTALLGGIAALSAKWNQYKKECAVERTIEQLEKANEEQPGHNTLVTHFVEVALTAAEQLEDARGITKSFVTERLQLLGMNIADGMPDQNEQTRAEQLVRNAMNVVRMTLDQMAYGDFHAKTDASHDVVAPQEPLAPALG